MKLWVLGVILALLEWSSGFPYFLQFQSEFGNKELMIWATVNSWSCFCWLYRASPSLAAKNITQYARKFGKLSSDHRTGKGQFSFQSLRKAMPKNAQTTTQLQSSHTLAESCSKFSKPGFNSMWTVNFQMVKVDLAKAEEPESNCQLLDHCKTKRVWEKHLHLLYQLHQSLWLCGSQKPVENSERDGNTRPPELPPEKSVCKARSNSEN